MNLYLSGWGGEDKWLYEYGIKRVLISYADIEKGNKRTKIKTLKQIINNYESVFLDSGAFSMKNKEPQNINEYCEFIKNTGIEIYSVLDVIGSAQKTYENQVYMEKNGLFPIPCYHLGTDIEYLYKYLDKKYNYISIGGMVHNANLDAGLRYIWAIIYKERPNIKVHGFGLTSIQRMGCYPWFSIDSSTYLAGVRYGKLELFNGKDIYRTNSNIYKKQLKAKLYKDEKFQLLTEKQKNAKLHRMIKAISAQDFQKAVNKISKEHEKKSFDFLCGQINLF